VVLLKNRHSELVSESPLIARDPETSLWRREKVQGDGKNKIILISKISVILRK